MKINNKVGGFWIFTRGRCQYIPQGVSDVPENVAQYFSQHYEDTIELLEPFVKPQIPADLEEKIKKSVIGRPPKVPKLPDEFIPIKEDEPVPTHPHLIPPKLKKTDKPLPEPKPEPKGQKKKQ